MHKNKVKFYVKFFFFEKKTRKIFALDLFFFLYRPNISQLKYCGYLMYPFYLSTK